MNKYNLGCGNDIRKGYKNIDISKHRKEIDQSVDLNILKWSLFLLPADEILAYDVVEHLKDTVVFMDNCWRVLVKDGVLDIKACGWKNPNYWVDPTHKNAFDIRSFDYFDPSTDLGTRYGYYTKLRWKILHKELDRKSNVLIKLTPIK